jgi:hypothetical protein
MGLVQSCCADRKQEEEQAGYTEDGVQRWSDFTFRFLVRHTLFPGHSARTVKIAFRWLVHHPERVCEE